MDGPLNDVGLDIVDSIDKAGEFKRDMGERREVLGVDTESAGLMIWRDKLRLIQFGDTRKGWAIPWEQWGGVALEVLRDYDGPLVFHNQR